MIFWIAVAWMLVGGVTAVLAEMPQEKFRWGIFFACLFLWPFVWADYFARWR